MNDSKRTPPTGKRSEHPSDKRSFRTMLSSTFTLLQHRGIAFLILGVLLLVAAGAWYAIARDLDGWVRGLAIGGLAAIAIYALLRPEDLERTFGGRFVRYGSSAVVLSVVTIGIVVLLYLFLWWVARAMRQHLGRPAAFPETGELRVRDRDGLPDASVSLLEPVVVGRSTQADLVIDDPFASDFHARVGPGEEGFTIQERFSSSHWPRSLGTRSVLVWRLSASSSF